MNEGGNYIFRKLSKNKFCKINTQKYYKSNIFSARAFKSKYCQYADVNRIASLQKICLNAKIKEQAIEQFCEQCDHIIALWDGQPDIVKEVIDYAVEHHKSISFFELDSLLYTEKLDNLGRVILPSTIRQKLDILMNFPWN